MNPGPASLLELLARDEKARFVIPQWRRSYSWQVTGSGPREVERLWQDLRAKCSGEGKLFCGVVLIHKLETAEVSTWEIIDGQQRIATFFLLLIALRDSCEKRGVDCTDLNHLLKTANSDDCRLVLHGGSSDDRRVMNALLRRTAFSLESKIRNENKVFLAYRYLGSRIESEISSGSQEFLVSILQGAEFRLQLEEPTEQTRRAFETLDTRNKEVAKDVAPPKPVKSRKEVPAGQGRPRLNGGLLATMVVLIVAAILGVWITLGWNNDAGSKINYYAETTDRLGMPEGLTKLSDDQAQHRNLSYRVASDHRKVRHVTEVNGTGHPVDNPARHSASTEQIQYDEKGNLRQIAYLNHTGREVFLETYSNVPGDIASNSHRDISFKFEARETLATKARNFRLLGEGAYGKGNSIESKGEITGEFAEFAADGRLKQIQFHNNSGKPRPDSNGVFARSFEYNPAGQATKISNLGADGKPAPDKHGVATLVQTFDASGNQTGGSWLGIDGQPILNKDGFAQATFKYDEHGNKVGVSYLGIDGKPVFSREGFSQLKAMYDDYGNLTEQSCLGLQGEPVLCSSGFFIEMLKYDSNGNAIEASYLGVDAKPTLTKEGFATEKIKYDGHGNVIERTYLDTDGKPVLNKDGYASETLKYDDHDNAVEIAGFGLDGQPILGSDGFAKATFKYNDRGDKIEASYFDVVGQPVLNKRGLASETYTYDEKGNVIEQLYFGVDNHPVLNKDGAAKLTAKYDERGNVIETDCFDLNGQPALDKSGVARETYKYDERDNVIEADCFGIDGQPVLDHGGVAIATFKYDNLGRKIQADYSGTDGLPILNRGGFSRQTFKFDARGCMIEGAYFDAKGQPTLGPNHFSIESLKYDDRGRIIEGICLGVDGLPTEVGGANRIVYTYDNSTNKISKTDRYDKSGQLLP